MRAPILCALLLVSLLPTPAAAQAGLASVDPTIFFWDDYAQATAAFKIRVNNNAGQADAFTITEITVDPPIAVPIGATYTPTPTLVVPAGGQGVFNVWVGGFDQPPPAGPAAGNYTVRITVQSTTDAQRQQTVEARIQRTHPADEGTGTITGSLRDSRTGGIPVAFGPIELTVHDAQSVRTLPDDVARTTLDDAGEFRFEVPPGRYWLRVEASGYQTNYVGPLNVAEGAGPHADISLSPNAFGRFQSNQPRVVDLGLPSQGLAGSVDLATVATTPGGYDRAADPAPENVVLLGADAQARWARALPPRSAVPYDDPMWMSTDNAVDVSADGFRVAVGTAGGTIEIFAADGQPVMVPYRGEGDVNPKVPGPLGRGILRASEVRFSHDGTRLAAGSLTGWVYVFDAINGTLLWKEATLGQIRALRFSPDDSRLYAASGDNNLYAFDADARTLLWNRPLEAAPQQHIGLANDGRSIATGGADGVLRLFDDAGTTVWTRQLPAPILGFDLSTHGQQVIAMTAFGIHSYNRDGVLRWFRGETDNHGQIRMGAGGTYIAYGKATTGADGPAMRILTSDGTLAWEHRTQEAEAIRTVLALDDGSRIVANGQSGNVYFFEHWTIPPSGTRGPSPDETERPNGGSPAPGAVLLLLVLGWIAWRRRQR